MDTLSLVSSFFATRRTLWQEQGLCCALSGGADSVALALMMHQLRLPFTALHCNFHLRGTDSNNDEEFVRDFCQQHNIPLVVQHFDVEKHRATTHESVEMAARSLRYAWFAQQRGFICVAHHADDQAETLLLNLLRSTGLRGLAGMAEENGRIWRPLLRVPRASLSHYLSTAGQSHVEDASNADTHYRRNWLRHRVLPLLAEENPSIHQTLAQTAQHCRQALAVFEMGLQTIAAQVKLPPSHHPVLHFPLQAYDHTQLLSLGDAGQLWWREEMASFGFTTEEARQALVGSEGFWIQSATHQLCRHQSQLLLAPLHNTLPTLEQTHYTRRADFRPSRHAAVVTLDADAIVGEVFLRRIKAGDRFQPLGFRKGSKLVSDYLTDRHRSRIDKHEALAVCDETGILWLVGETIAQQAAVNDSTTTILQLSLGVQSGVLTKKLPPADE